MSALGPKLDAIRAAKEVYEAKLKDAAEDIKESLVDAVKSIPGVQAVEWNQYTPYFNDGDACNFGINEVYFFTDKSLADAVARNEGEPLDPGEWAEDRGGISACYAGWNEKWGPSDDEPDGWDSPLQYASAQELTGFIHGCADLMERAFGDHVTVRIDKDGLTTEEYDHD